MSNDDILNVLVNAVKRSYKEYCLATLQYLDSSFIDEDGKVCYSVGCKELMDAAERLYLKDGNDLTKFRMLLQNGDQDEINEFLAAKGFDTDEIS